MKNNQRLEYSRLADALAEKGLVDQKALKDALQYSGKGGPPFPEALVEAKLVTDWEVSRMVCEVYGLPFLTVEIATPDPNAFAGLNTAFLQEHALVPIAKYGQVLTVCMPAMVEADVLASLAKQSDLFVLPVVGTVRSNRVWLETNLQPAAPLPAASGEETGVPDSAEGWSSFFDEADAAVLLDLQSGAPDPDPADSL